jgi:hypothetical protein
MRLTTVFVLLIAATLAASDAYPPPLFTDAGRVAKLQSAMPEIDRLFRAYATDKMIPGMIWGVVIDGQLAHQGAFGVGDRASQTPITPDTAFRIASMTKSFTALAVLKLRDDGRLSLEDPVSRWIGEFARMERPTRDTPPLTIRQLLSHSAGFQRTIRGATSAERHRRHDGRLAREGHSVLHAARHALRIFQLRVRPAGPRRDKAAGVPYMAMRARGDPLETAHGRVHVSVRGTSRPRAEPSVTASSRTDLRGGAAACRAGVFGSMGALLTTTTDLGSTSPSHVSVAGEETMRTRGRCRSSVREMAHLWTPSNLTARRVNGTLRASETGYGFGLRVTSDCRFEQIVAHGGGLPGFGSHGVAAGLWRGNVRDGDADVFRSVRTDQPGVGRDA